MIYLLLALIVLALMFDTRAKSEEVEGSKHFYISDGASKDMYLKMHQDNIGSNALKRFVQMEDAFLQLEQMSVCSGISRIVQASILSNKIKDAFPRYNFSYHTVHLKQIAEPNKTINRKIRCT
jgi:uncharacterized protein YsxB (DUF464 family)